MHPTDPASYPVPGDGYFPMVPPAAGMGDNMSNEMGKSSMDPSDIGSNPPNVTSASLESISSSAPSESKSGDKPEDIRSDREVFNPVPGAQAPASGYSAGVSESQKPNFYEALKTQKAKVENSEDGKDFYKKSQNPGPFFQEREQTCAGGLVITPQQDRPTTMLGQMRQRLAKSRQCGGCGHQHHVMITVCPSCGVGPSANQGMVLSPGIVGRLLS